MPGLFPPVLDSNGRDIVVNDPMTNDPPANPSVEICTPQEITGPADGVSARQDNSATPSTPEFMPGTTPVCNSARVRDSAGLSSFHQERNMWPASV
jgi:hypothetical protein